MKAALTRVGCAMIGQTAEIAPADKKLYALRDVTGTVESIPLISASIMSKKIAEGIDALVLDVKTGSGAFMKTEADSRRLAESLVSIGNASGVKTEAIITTDGCAARPRGRQRARSHRVHRGAEGRRSGGSRSICRSSWRRACSCSAGWPTIAADGERRIRAAIASGAGLERFRRIIEQQGGDPRVVDDYGRLPTAPERHLVEAPRAGFLTGLDAELVGRASVVLGAGRDRVGQPVDPAVGIMVLRKPGEELRAGDPVLDLHYRDRSRLEDAMELAHQAIADRRPTAGAAAADCGEVR